MKKLLLLSLSLIIFLAGCSFKSDQPQMDKLDKIKQRGKLIVGVKYDSKPFGFVNEKNQVQGFDIDIAREMAKSILGDPNAVEFKQVTSSNRIFMLTSDAIDVVIATMTINPKRLEVVDFSQPYYIAGQAIMIPQNSDIRGIKDLNNKKVIIVLGSTSEKNIRMMAPDAVIQGFRTYNDAFSALKAGRGNALTTDDSILYGFLDTDKNFKILPERYTKEPYGIAIKKGTETETLRMAIDESLYRMEKDGTLKKIKHKWVK
ncbi:MAG: transporter substrate-binding domain-containing protein [bacterium]